MTIGCLGDIVFSVSSNLVRTLSGLKQSGSASFSEHKRHNSAPILEFTGRGLKDVSFNMTLSRQLGVDVNKEIEKIIKYTESGKVLTFNLGKKTYGKGKWVIAKYTISHKYFDKRGDVTMADVSLSLKEYN